MEQYAYLLLDIGALLPLAVIYIKRASLRRSIIRIGLIGGIAGLVAELFYLRDYWRPVGIIPNFPTLIEDFMFGFAITALSAVLYGYISNKTLKRTLEPRRKAFVGLFIFGLLAMLICNVWLGGASIIVSSAVFIVISVYILMQRRDLIHPALVTSTLVTLYMFLVYIIVFYLLQPDWWNQHWLLQGTALDIKIWGSIPLTEMLWYASWALLASILSPYLRGKVYKTQ